MGLVYSVDKVSGAIAMLDVVPQQEYLQTCEWQKQLLKHDDKLGLLLYFNYNEILYLFVVESNLPVRYELIHLCCIKT